VKWRTHLRLLAVPLLTILFLAQVPSVEAASLHWPISYFRVKDKRKDKDDDKGRKKVSVPEGSGGAALVLAASALGGGLLISRRKRRAKAA
jgi:hypothetical protein